MSVTILEALMNAEHNLRTGGTVFLPLALEQLSNAVTLLEKGYSPYTHVEPLLEEYGDVEDVPEAPDDN